MIKDILNEMILEQLEPKLRELLGIEEPVDVLQEKGPVPDKIATLKGGDKSKQKQVSGPIDVSAIVSRLVATTGERSEDKPIKDIFKILTSNAGEAPDGDKSSAEVVDAFIASIFKQPSLQEDCVDISSIAKNALVNSAFSSLIENYNAIAAGFANEAFVAGLIGGKTIPTKSRVVEDVKLENIADIYHDKIGFISLKTKQKGKKVSGSLKNLMGTVGVPFVFQTVTKEGIIEREFNIKQERPLFYMYFKTPSKGEFQIDVAKVTRESLEKYLNGKLKKVKLKQSPMPEDSAPLQETKKKKAEETGPAVNGKWEYADDGEYFFLTKELKSEIESDKGFLLGSDFESTEISGIDGSKAEEKISMKDQTELNNIKSEDLRNQLIFTLNTLNNFFVSVEKSIFEYASRPTAENLGGLKNNLEDISQKEMLVINDILVCQEKKNN